MFYGFLNMPIIPENQVSLKKSEVTVNQKNDLVDVLRQKGIFYVIKKNFLAIPISIRMVGFSLFIFVLGWWLGADVFFSLYIKNIVDHILLISVIGAVLSLGKMLFSIPVGEINDHANLKSVIFLSKWIYAIMGILYVMAWMWDSVPLLIIAVLLNGLGTASLFVTYQTFIRKHTKPDQRGRSFGLYFSSINLAYVLWALISAYLITIIDLPHLFMFIPAFALLSLLTDSKLPSLNKKKIQAFLKGDSFTHRFIVEVFSFRPIKKVYLALKNYSHRMYYALGFEFLFSLLNYVGFIFIPIVSIKNSLTLSQVALVFAVMRLPYLINFFTGNLADKRSKRNFLFVVIFFLSILYVLLWFNEWFWNIMTISFGISFGLSLMRPVISRYISDCVNPKDEGMISWVAEFVGKFWEIIWVLLFGFSSALFGLQTSFIIIGIAIFLVAVIGIIKRFPWMRRG